MTIHWNLLSVPLLDAFESVVALNSVYFVEFVVVIAVEQLTVAVTVETVVVEEEVSFEEKVLVGVAMVKVEEYFEESFAAIVEETHQHEPDFDFAAILDSVGVAAAVVVAVAVIDANFVGVAIMFVVADEYASEWLVAAVE